MTPSKSHGQLYDVTVCSNYILHTFTSCGEVTMSYLLWWTVDVPILTIWQCSSSMMILSATWLLACYMYICWWYRYLLEDWSGSITASLHPVATKSATSRQGSMVGEGGQWEGRSVLIKVGSARVMDAGRGRKGVWGREWSKKRRGGTCGWWGKEEGVKGGYNIPRYMYVVTKIPIWKYACTVADLHWEDFALANSIIGEIKLWKGVGGVGTNFVLGGPRCIGRGGPI